MSFTLKDIDGAVILKSDCGTNTRSHPCQHCNGFNAAIEDQGKINLRFNREKLLKIVEGMYLARTFEITDAIIAADKDIVELDKE